MTRWDGVTEDSEDRREVQPRRSQEDLGKKRERGAVLSVIMEQLGSQCVESLNGISVLAGRAANVDGLEASP